MSLNFTSDIMTLFDTNVGNDANYQAPGNYGLTAALTGSVGVETVTITGAGSYAFNAQPTASPSVGSAVFSVRMKLVTVSAVVGAGTIKVPGDVLVVAGGTTSDAATVTVTHTKVVSVAINGVGSGGTPGASTLTGTTGTGTKFQATVVIQGDGTLTGAPAPVITVAGDYTVNPTLTAEPVTATASLVGVTVDLVMGVLTVSISHPGVYSALPGATPISANTSPVVGTAATFTLLFGVNSIVVTSGGAYETIAPTVNFSGAGGATATANLASASTQDEDTQKLFMMVELLRSLIAETTSVIELKDLHEVLRKMMMEMKFGGKTTYSAATMASRALDSAMNYVAKNPTHGGAAI